VWSRPRPAPQDHRRGETSCLGLWIAMSELGQSRRLAACRSLPVFHEQRTSSDRPGMSQRCHKRKFEHVCATLLSQDGKPHSLLLQRQYLRCRGFGAVASGAFGEIANVSQAFQPSGRFWAANSLKTFALTYPSMSPTGNRKPTCGPRGMSQATTRLVRRRKCRNQGVRGGNPRD
jgi:hypothetical protein